MRLLLLRLPKVVLYFAVKSVSIFLDSSDSFELSISASMVFIVLFNFVIYFSEPLRR